MSLKFRKKLEPIMNLEQALDILQADVEYTKLELKNSLFDQYAWSYIWAVRLVVSNLSTLGEIGIVDLKEEYKFPVCGI